MDITTSDTEKRDQLKVLLVNGSPRSDGNTFCPSSRCPTAVERKLTSHGHLMSCENSTA